MTANTDLKADAEVVVRSIPREASPVVASAYYPNLVTTSALWGL